MLLFVFYSEVFNFFFWFVKFAPLFVLRAPARSRGLFETPRRRWYPIHRAQWFQGGETIDYFKGTLSINTYAQTDKYQNPDFPRCVVPETKDVHSAQWRHARGGAPLGARRGRGPSE